MKQCYHCAERCDDADFSFKDKSFCCASCLEVYKLLQENDLCFYYELNEFAGKTATKNKKHHYDFLDSEETRSELFHFYSPTNAQLSFYIPQVHCSSCVWLLEQLNRLNSGIIKSELNLSSKELFIVFNPSQIQASELAQLLENIGYAPQWTVKNNKNYSKTLDRKHILKLAVAGFAFGNIMLLSLPEYLDIHFKYSEFRFFFPLICMILSLPLLVYSANDYFQSALYSIKLRKINLDIPVSIGILLLFFRSCYDFLYLGASGYFDSFAGFIFFLLLGKTFQMKYYANLEFDRDYNQYFPLSVLTMVSNQWVFKKIKLLKKADQIACRNQEILPCDSIITSESAVIDYSFVTGETLAQTIQKNDFVYAGARILGKTAEFEVINESENSYLRKLWNQADTQKDLGRRTEDTWATIFSTFLLFICILCIFVFQDLDRMELINRISAILIVACPCALAISAPFTWGAVAIKFAKNGLFFKNSLDIERMANTNHIVFDKTGTVSDNEHYQVDCELTDPAVDLSKFSSLASQSIHPLSHAIYRTYRQKDIHWSVHDFDEKIGYGISGKIDYQSYFMGSQHYLMEQGILCEAKEEKSAAEVYLGINSHFVGKVQLQSRYRNGLKRLISDLKNFYTISICSGDNQRERDQLIQLGFPSEQLFFNMKANEKEAFIKRCKTQGQTVLMLGDGLNDSHALRQADCGISVIDSNCHFHPSAPAIIQADSLPKLAQFLSLAKKAKQVVLLCYSISVLYNIIGLYYAMQGLLSPLISAVLMPLSSVTIISVAMTLTHYFSKKADL